MNADHPEGQYIELRRGKKEAYHISVTKMFEVHDLGRGGCDHLNCCFEKHFYPAVPNSLHFSSAHS
jgi:hypothetical protein